MTPREESQSRKRKAAETVPADRILLERITNGDPAAFWQIWQLHEKELRHCCRQWVGGNSQDAEDLLGVAMVKLWDELPRNASKITNLRAWLIGLTHNLWIDLLLRHERYLRVTSGAASSSPESPDQTFQRAELRAHLRRAIHELPPSLRQAFELRYLQEMAYPEIAERLKTSPGNVRKRIQHARCHLRSKLHGFLPPDRHKWRSSIVNR